MFLYISLGDEFVKIFARPQERPFSNGRYQIYFLPIVFEFEMGMTALFIGTSMLWHPGTIAYR